MKIPALFVGHGSPTNAISQNVFNEGFASIVKTFAKPKAILCISAHWYSSALQIQTNPNPPMIYDFHGFADELYQVSYPAKGSSELVQKVSQLLFDEGISQNPTRGYDHGAWAVLKHLYPNADILWCNCHYIVAKQQMSIGHWHKNYALCVMKAC